MFRRLHLLLVGLIVGTASVVTIAALFVVDRAVEGAARADIVSESRELLRYQKNFKVVSVADAIDFRISLGAPVSQAPIMRKAIFGCLFRRLG